VNSLLIREPIFGLLGYKNVRERTRSHGREASAMTITRRHFSAGTVAGLITFSRAAIAQQIPKLTVRTDFLPWGMHAGLHLGVVKGWFKEAGVDVDVSDGRGSTVTMQQVATGDVDIGWVQLGAMAVVRGKGVPITSIAGLARRGDLGALVPKDSGLKTVKDLEGKKVAYTAGTSWGTLVDPFFAAGGSSKDKVNLVSVDQTALLSIYMSGAVDATLTTYPFAKTTADRQRPSNGILLADVGINIPSYGLVCAQRTLDTRRDVLRRFVPVVVRAWEHIYNDNKIDEGVEAIVKQRPNERLDLEIVRGQIVEYKPFMTTEATKGKRFGWQSDDDWKGTIDILEKTKAIPAGSKPADYYTNEFVPS
jgi:NitT/TauT family transport system substrate-binding protein